MIFRMVWEYRICVKAFFQTGHAFAEVLATILGGYRSSFMGYYNSKSLGLSWDLGGGLGFRV